jgi:peroxiredoxin
MRRSSQWSVVILLMITIAPLWAQEPAAKPATTPPADAAKPAEVKPPETKPVETKPAETKPADVKAPEPNKAAAPLPPGHSTHGEAFNEGPRQKAYLMKSTGNVHFPVTTKMEEAQAFFNQGVGQLHGFWYFEAERSFRQVALLDPNCAMAYWGMAMANTNNLKRARGFIAEAVKRKEQAGEREKMYIDAFDAYLKADEGKKKERAEAYTKAIEKILLKFPDDLEAKAFLVLQLWLNRDAGIPISSYLAIDALLEQIFAVNPMHPAHHYRIHLWDYEQAEKALTSAASGGQAAPGIAHMWHMPGHTYSRLRRYDDACYQQEASARVDHAHMMRDRVLPDQIHNFAHNNEWLIRNLIHVGRIRDAVELAKNMIELPRHTKYNNLDKGGSYKFGRERLFDVLRTFELWDETIAMCQSPYLDPTEKDNEQIKRQRRLGEAYARKGAVERCKGELVQLQERFKKEQEARDKAGTEAESKAKESAVDKKKVEEAAAAAEKKAKDDAKDEAGIAQAKAEAEKKSAEEQLKAKEKDIAKARDDARKAFDSKINSLEKATQELEGHLAVAAGDFKRGAELIKKAGDYDTSYLALLQFQAGEVDAALKEAQKQVDTHKNEVEPLACQIDLFWRANKKEDARKVFDALRGISGSLDRGTPVFDRLTPIAKELGYPDDWRMKKTPANDVGQRPSLDQLGPFRWQPSPAPDWTLNDANGQPYSSKEFRGRPYVLIFYLGYSCLHCAEQLQKFAPLKDQFTQAGLSVLAVSTDDQAGLKMAIGSYEGGKFPLTLLSNDKLDAFQQYRCYDDFEKKPLHGTFVVDGKGRVRWQDISYEPFMDPTFVLNEAKRLLAHDATATPSPLISTGE